MKYWTDPWGIVHGCSPISEACIRCWAASEANMRVHQKNPKMKKKYDGITLKKDGIPTFNGKVILENDPAILEKPLRARKPRIYAVGWGGDLFHEKVPDDFITKIFSKMAVCERHKFLILTKRTKRMAEYMNTVWYGTQSWVWNNIYFGTTVENQKAAEERIPWLLQVPGTLWLSMEPLLGPVNLHLDGTVPSDISSGYCHVGDLIRQVIVGGETGHGARLYRLEWFTSIRDQCFTNGVPFFFKGWGKWIPESQIPIEPYRETFKGGGESSRPDSTFHLNKKQYGRLINSHEHNDLIWVI